MEVTYMEPQDCYYDKNTLENLFSRNYNSDIIEGIALREDSLQPFHNRYPNQTPLQMLMLSSFYHQASFIKRHLQLRNMYDENLRIVSDWKWFIKSILIYGASYTFFPRAISYFTSGGISSTSLIISETKKLKKELFPKNMSYEDREILIKLSFIRSYKITYLLFKALGIIAWRIDSFMQKQFTRY